MEPEAIAGEVIVRVSAAGLHPIVKALANGTHYGSTGVLPFIPGVDGVGKLEDGSRVYFGISRSPLAALRSGRLRRGDVPADAGWIG